MTYKESLTAAMSSLAVDPLVRFVGYGLLNNKGANGTIRDVSESQIIETPISEGLMMGLATGMSLRGLRPVVYIERMDFIPLCMDAMVNQLDSIARLSRGQFQPAAIIRVMVGSKSKPPFTALTHTRDFTETILKTVSFPVVDFNGPGWAGAPIIDSYSAAHRNLKYGQSTMLIDHREFL